MNYVSLDEVLNTLHRFGITTLNDRERYGLAITLGGGEIKLIDLTYAYSVFANQGVQVGEEVPLEKQRLGYAKLQPTPFLRITDSRGNVLYDYTPKSQKLIEPELAYQITAIITDNEAQEPTYGPNNELLMPRPSAAKTGTTEWYQDSWTIGYTPDIVAGAWVGNADNHPMKRVVGASGAGKIWNSFIQYASRNTPPKEFIVPSGLVHEETWETDPITSKWQLRRDWFLPNQAPSAQPQGSRSGYYLDVSQGRNEYNMPTVNYAKINIPQYFTQGTTYWTTEDLVPELKVKPDATKPFTPYWQQVTNTADLGAYLRVTPTPDDKMVLLPEGTKLLVISNDVVLRKTNWKHVRDEQGREGWLPDYWVGNIPGE
jgi:membrane peptidoglycan carboxypeptidase